MKNLKLNFTFFSLLAILSISVFLTSCEQENIPSDVIEQNITNPEIAAVLILPNGYDKNLSAEEINEYLNKMEVAETNELIENNRIATYLINIGKFDKVQSTLGYGEKFTNVELQNFLSEEEISGLNNFIIVNQAEPGTVDDRGLWGSWKLIWEGSVCGAGTCYCYYLRYRRECHQFGSNYFQYATVGYCSGAALPSGGWC